MILWKLNCRGGLNIKDNLFFCESLDSVLQKPEFMEKLDSTEDLQRVGCILKESALFSEQIILSATQFVDNRGIRDILLEKPGFQHFLEKAVKVGMPPEISSFNELVNNQIKARMLFSSFPSLVQKAVGAGEIPNIYELDRRFPQLHYKYFIEKLDETYNTDKNKIQIKYKPYADLVEKRLGQSEKLQDVGAKKLCSELMNRTKEELKLVKKDVPSRSIFYSAIDKSPYNSYSKNIVKRFFIDYEYNKNFYETNKFDCLTHPDSDQINIFKYEYPSITEEFNSAKYRILDPIEAEGKLNLDTIDFEFLGDLHSDYKNRLETLLTKIRNTDNSDSRKEAYQNYFDFLIPKIKENSEKQSTYNKKVEKFAVSVLTGMSLASLTYAMPYFTTEIGSIVLGGGGGSAIGFFITDLIEKKISLPKQTSRFYEMEKYLKNIRLEREK